MHTSTTQRPTFTVGPLNYRHSWFQLAAVVVPIRFSLLKILDDDSKSSWPIVLNFYYFLSIFLIVQLKSNEVADRIAISRVLTFENDVESSDTASVVVIRSMNVP